MGWGSGGSGRSREWVGEWERRGWEEDGREGMGRE